LLKAILVAVPPTALLALFSVVGWIQLELSLGTALVVVAVYGGWLILLMGLTEIVRSRQSDMPPGLARGVPYQPANPIPEFVGREPEIELLTRHLEPGSMAAIVGPAQMDGLGKTELAKVIAYHLSGRFPDGVLWADCRHQTLDMTANLWAAAYGVELSGPTLEDKEIAWRTLIGDKKTLLILDDVQLDQQIERLFPTRGESAVLITSRRSDHPALRGVYRLDLKPFAEQEATALLERVQGREIDPGQNSAALHTYELTSHLPLTLSLALRLAQQHSWSLGHLNNMLEASGAKPGQNGRAEFRSNLAATLETVWNNLPADLRQPFHALAQFSEGPSFSTLAVAEALYLTEPRAEALLRRLADYSLVLKKGQRRWTLHRTVREFLDTLQPVPTAVAARMAHYYKNLASTAEALYVSDAESTLYGLVLLAQEWPHIRMGQGWAAAHIEDSQDVAQLCSDYANVVANWLGGQVSPVERIRWLDAAARAARRLGDKEAEGRHLGNLGSAYADLGETQLAFACYDQGLALAREIGDRRGEAKRLGNMGLLAEQQGDKSRAQQLLGDALDTFEAIDHPNAEQVREWLAELAM
jgi:tetratricopeptide (TPR) repeat protein